MFAALFSIIAFSYIPLSPTNTAYAATSDSETVMPLSDRIIWRYKTINGVLYKRLYNVTKQQWVGNWIKF